MRAQTLKPDRTAGRGGRGWRREEGNIRRQKTAVEQETKVIHSRSGSSDLGFFDFR